MGCRSRFDRIEGLLNIALDSEEEYLYQGEMCEYMRSYADDAASELDMVFRRSEPTAAELDCWVEALSHPKRIERGRSKQLLIQLEERSPPILDALSNSSDPQLRIFAIETASSPRYGIGYTLPLYGSIDQERLLNDPNEDVQIAAISAAKQTIQLNVDYLHRSLQASIDNRIVDLFYRLLTLLDNPSEKVRAAASKALASWASPVELG